MRDLYLIQNIMIFMEQCMIKMPTAEDRYTINPHYVKNADTFVNLIKDIRALFPDLYFVSYEDCKLHNWNNIYMSSYMPEEFQPELKKMPNKEIILVEDGLFDYTLQEKDYPFYKGKKLYMFDPASVSETAKQADVRILPVRREVLKHFESDYRVEIERLRTLPKDTPILFTSPLEEDFEAADGNVSEILDYLHNNMGIDKVIIKRHPRDYGTYKLDGMQIFECPQNIPGQFVDRAFEGKKVYLFPSTVSFMSEAGSDIVFLNPMPFNKEYTKQFRRILKLAIFKNHAGIQILTMNNENMKTTLVA